MRHKKGEATLALALLLSATAFAAEDRQVSVSGICNHLVAPDRGAIVLTAEVNDPDLQTAARKATEEYDRLRTAIKRMDLEALDLRTAEYQLIQVREWEKGKSVMKGYRARMGLRVATASTQKLGDVISAAAREGIQDVGGLSTFLSEEKEQKEHAACLQEAAENARSKAEKLATSLGAKLGPVLTITEYSVAPQPPMPLAQNTMALSASARNESMPAPSVEAGQQNLSVSVQASFALR